MGISGNVNVSNNIYMNNTLFIRAHDTTSNSLAIGVESGETGQGINAIALGYKAGKLNQHSNTIVLNASGEELNTGGIDRLYVKPVRSTGTETSNVLAYASNGEIIENSVIQISSDGNVGIGTTTDPAYKVDINGDVNFTGSLYKDGVLFTGQSEGSGSSVAIGTDAGLTSQGSYAVAVGNQAGMTNQGSAAVAVGKQAGKTSQKNSAIAVGESAGEFTQGLDAVSIGKSAGKTSQGDVCIAIGRQAGQTGQENGAIAIGTNAGTASQQSSAIAVGESAGYSNQGSNAVAVGYLAGQNSQGNSAIAVGELAGLSNQSSNTVAIGLGAGYSNQGSYAVAIGTQAGQISQGSHAISIGNQAGFTGQERFAVAIGSLTGAIDQGIDAVAIGESAGYSDQGAYAVAVGYLAGNSDQGAYAVAIGYAAGQISQPADSFYVRYASVRGLAGTYYGLFINTLGEIQKNTSDDRLKYNETFIKDAVKSLSKLRPQEYLKGQKLNTEDPEQGWTYEAGLMAQEVYYSAPELRHIVMVPEEAGDIDNYTPPPSDDPTQDPDYSSWGNQYATVDYKQLTPYLVKAVQEIVTELPRSKTTVSNTWGQNIQGLIVSANTNAHKTNVTPIVTLSNVTMDKSWYGVVSSSITDTNDYDTLVDTKGDTLIWISDVGGTLKSGDFITTSDISPGFAQKQVDDIVHNYTVAKVTQDCNFSEPPQRNIKVPKKELSNVMYYRHDSSYEINLEKYENVPAYKVRVEETSIYFKEVNTRDKIRYYHGDTEVSEVRYNSLPNDGTKSVKYLSEISVEDYNALDDSEKSEYSPGTSKKYILLNYSYSKTKIPQHDEEVFIEERIDVLDENGQIIWEDTGETEPVYTLVDHGNHKAALVTCKLV